MHEFIPEVSSKLTTKLQTAYFKWYRSGHPALAGLRTSNTEHGTQNTEHKTRNAKHETQNTKQKTKQKTLFKKKYGFIK